MSDLPPSVVLDPVMLRQILLNLLSNAVKFTPAGSVTLNVAGADAGNGEVQLSFRVVDTGIGIRAEDHARIFASFEQVGPSHQGGTGLGLTISQQYVQMMGGELALDSEPGKGSTFRFAITAPRGLSGSTKAARGRVSAIEPADHGQRILVVDDIPEARLLVRSLLEPLGFVVSEAATAAAAEAAIATTAPDLVFMDWFLPDGNGLEIITRVRQGKTGKQPRLVMLTANAMKESRQAALLAGADDFLSKPFEEEALFRILEKHLALRLIRDPLPASPSSVGATRQISAEDLAGLRCETRASLAQAALSLNPEKIGAALRSVAQENPELAASLGEFANTRQYQALWQGLGILEAEE